jgi:phenylpropionate dioxygenase-like ring-hydroxylating dioxygenase large terminal subunit
MSERVSDDLLWDIWYFALPSASLVAGRLVARTLLGEPVVFGRQPDGIAFALRDICPHRGIPLSDGRMTRGEVECCYHGWRFGADGVCTSIPSLVDGQEMDVSRIRVRRYPINEAAGCLWIFMASDPAKATDPPPPPTLLPMADRPKLTEALEFPCHVDHACIDPGGGAPAGPFTLRKSVLAHPSLAFRCCAMHRPAIRRPTNCWAVR